MKNEADYIRANDRHGEYYSLLLQQRGIVFKGADQPSAASELASEIANLRQAWRWAGERGQALQVGQAADTLFWLYEFRCDCREGVPLFGHVANRLDVGNVSITGTASSLDETRVITQARVMAYQGFFCLRQGLHPQSKDLLERSLAMLRPLAAGGSFVARDALSNTLAFLGMLTVSLGDYTNGNRFLNEGLEIKRANKDGWGIAFCLRQLGVLGFYQGAYDEADRLLNEGLEVSRGLGNAWAIAYSLDFLSAAAYARGAYAEAEKLLREGLMLSQKVGDRFTTAYALNGLGMVKKACGESTEARELLNEGIAIWREIGDHASLAQSLNNLGDVLLEMKNFSEAKTNFVEALSVAKKAGLFPTMLDSLLGEAILRVHVGEKDFAIKALAHILHHPASTQGTKNRAEKIYADLSKEGLDITRDSSHEDTFKNLVEDVLGKYASSQAFA
jgi:tetratricopeptide (TPR) repeat protein